MALFYQHNINDSTRLAVWHITEHEDFFSKKVNIQKEITHPHKRLQHLAGRYLLQILYPEFPLHLIEIAESKKPVLGNGKFHFSISHCRDYAAAIVSEDTVAGIDVELITPKIELVKNKFLSQSEIGLAKNDFRLLTLFWSSKEAVYKWYGKGNVSFKNNIVMDHLFFENEQGIIDAHFIKEKRTELKIEFRFFHDLCLAWVVK
jgi:phosphopantetheinyl transferase